MAEKPWKDSQLRKYHFPTEQIPRLSHTDPRADDLISEGQPVVITGTDLVAPARRWDLDYLVENIGDSDFSVYESDNHLFKYYDQKKVKTGGSFVPGMRSQDIKFEEFVKKIRNRSAKSKRIYLQQQLYDTIGSTVVADFLQFNWRWAEAHQKRCGWGPLTSNLLLISQEGNVTPCHYDEQENFFCQVKGYKRVIMFPPSHFNSLYPYPVHHPHDRQCMVDLENPDFGKFPKFQDVEGVEAVLGPGDVLYLPMYWFHHFESLLDSGITMSITFWYKAAPTAKVEYPLKPQQKMAMMRNIEKMITDALNNTDEVAPFMSDMVLGRYTTS